MKWMVGIVVAVLAHRASASECNEFTPQVAESSIIAGCWMTVYVHPDADVSMTVTASHAGGAAVPIQATIAENSVAIDVTLDELDDCSENVTHESVAYRAFTISGFDVPVGAYVTTGGECAFAPPPSFSCTSVTQPCTGNDDLKCNAGGPSGFAAILLVLGFISFGGRTSSRVAAARRSGSRSRA